MSKKKAIIIRAGPAGLTAAYELLDKTDITKEPDAPHPGKQDQVMLVRTRLSRIFFLRKFFNYPMDHRVVALENDHDRITGVMVKNKKCGGGKHHQQRKIKR